MAKLKDSLYIKNRSTRGAITGQQQQGTLCARRHSEPVRRASFLSTSWQQLGRQIIRLWRNLSTPDQNLWWNFGIEYPQTDKYGNLIELSGWNWFSKINYPAIHANLPPILKPPPDDQNSYNPYTTVYKPIGSLHYHFFANTNPTGYQRFQIYRSINQPLSQQLPPNPPIPWATFFHDVFPDPIVLHHAEIQSGPRIHHFSSIALDEYSRAADIKNYKITTGV